jgi:hypothetical protein
MDSKATADQSSLILRVRHARGTARISLPFSNQGAVNNADIYRATADALAIDARSLRLFSDPQCQQPIDRSGLSHDIPQGAFVFVPAKLNPINTNRVDAHLRTLDGRKLRPRSAWCSTHGLHGMCEHCRPLEAWERSGDAKHQSLQTYMRQNGLLRVEVPEYSVLERHRRWCSTQHAPYPAGLCSKCQPSAISLQRQPFRVTDHVEFSPVMHAKIDAFLEHWRRTGWQQFAWLLGHYAPYTTTDAVPLGVKAVVADLWIPPQDNAQDGFKLTGQWRRDLVDANRLLRELYDPGLGIVGMLYTDLQPLPPSDGQSEEKSTGKVQYRRRPETFFLTGSELLFMADLQNDTPYAIDKDNASVGLSRFVTVVLSGNANAEIDLFAYQASLQSQSLRASNLVSACTDPSVLLLGPDEDVLQERGQPLEAIFVPTVIYQRDNQYGLTVPHCDDRQVPTDYLIVNLTHGFVNASKENGGDGKGEEFRPTMPERLLVDGSLAGSVQELLKAKAFLAADDFERLLEEIRACGQSTLNAALQGLKLENSSADSSAINDMSWSCTHCTFINEDASARDCSMCGLPQGQ